MLIGGRSLCECIHDLYIAETYRPRAILAWDGSIFFHLAIPIKSYYRVRWWVIVGQSFNVIEIDTSRQAICDFLLVFHCNYIIIFHRFRDKTTYWSKISRFFAVLSTPYISRVPQPTI